MPTYSEITSQIADQWIDALENAEKVAASVSEQGRRIAESLPQPAPIKLDGLEKLSDLSALNLPSAAEIVEANFDLASRVLTAQRNSALRLIETIAAANPATKTAPKEDADA